MHPILFRIPLPFGPEHPFKLWWGLVAVAVVALIFALVSFRNNDRKGMVGPFVVAIGAVVVAAMFRATSFPQTSLPIYSYGVMLGASLIVGWYLTLTLADKIGLPKETMANCYVVTAFAAVAGARILYVVTNPAEFTEAGEFAFKTVFALRKGGLVAYGGFLGGFLGSFLYLRTQGIKLLPWADVVVPSLGSGLMITRIGCYLFGCDYGKVLSDSAPGFLKKLGTFPHWDKAVVDIAGEGSPAYDHHWKTMPAMHDQLLKANASLPVHPTQIYESLVGLGLLGLLLWRRKSQKFRGEQFFLFVYAYGVCRFLLELLRDDNERGEYGPIMGEHLLIPGSLALFALGFAFAYSKEIKNVTARYIAIGVAFLIPAIAYFKLAPGSFAGTRPTQLSTSQIIALLTALLASYFHMIYAQKAEESPRAAMALGLPGEDKPKKKRKKKKVDAVASEEALAAEGIAPETDSEAESDESEASKPDEDDPKPA